MNHRSLTLGEALKRSNNNADVFRLMAALAVIWGHSFALAPAKGLSEPIGDLLGFDYSGSLAVKFFFFLSGILVTVSWIRNPSPMKFALARIFRIFPALIVSAMIMMLMVGPLLTTLPRSDYFGNTWMYEHIIVSPQMGYALPGVFQRNAYTAANGSLWTISYELLMYTVLLGLGMCCLFRLKAVAFTLCAASVIWFMANPESITVFGMLNVNEAGTLPAFFAFGALLAIFKDSIRIDGKVVIGLCLLAWTVRGGPAFKYAFYPAFLLAPIWLMTTRPLKMIRLPGDFSYGVYVYGWPIQQVFAALFPHAGPHTNAALSMPTSVLVGAASWYLIEKPAIAFGHKQMDLIARAANRQADAV
ncbi:hypothetical protein A9R05_05585 [Burkholderia sp. KK1]|nr:hypothetical protein A9R05_05585 [Burkholderia sp. KK1]